MSEDKNKLYAYEVRRPVEWNESGIVKDCLLLTEEQAKEVEAIIKSKHPGLLLVRVYPRTYRELTDASEYTLP